MELYSGTEEFKLYHGSMLDMLSVIKPKSIDSIVTDPPYELNFMGKGWDNSGIAFQKETWEKCFQVLKPGGYLLAFGGSRTFHRIACAIEDAGFEIRDTIMWLYGSGFPKSMNIGKGVESKLLNGSANTQDFRKLKGEMVATGNWGMSKLVKEQGYRPTDYCEDQHLRVDKVDFQTEEGAKWNGWGTALKPAYEPIIVARKPCEGSCIDNVLEYGVGGINIDGCRVGTDVIKGGTTPNFRDVGRKQKEISGVDKLSFGQVSNAERMSLEDHTGRFPANVILTYDDTDFQEVCGGMPTSDKANGSITKEYKMNNQVYGDYGHCNTFEAYQDSGSAARYYYCAKASKRDRDEGLERFEVKTKVFNGQSDKSSNDRNTHPTVKPVDLMQYLVRLVTPPSGTVLDPFNGSGSTGKATMYENKDRGTNYRYIGIELTKEYLPIAEARIRYAANDNTPIEVPQPQMAGQITFEDLLGDSVQANG